MASDDVAAGEGALRTWTTPSPSALAAAAEVALLANETSRITYVGRQGSVVDASDPRVAVQLMNAILQTHPAIVIDGGPGTTCRATAPLMRSETVEFCLSPVLQPEPGSGVFSTGASSHDTLLTSIRYLRERGLKKIAFIVATDATGQDADIALAEAMKLKENATIQLVAQEHFNLTDLSVTAQLSRIKAAAPQAIIAFVTGTAIATILHGANDLGMDVPVVSSPGNMSFPQLESYRSFLPSELLFPGAPVAAPGQVTDAGVKTAVDRFIGAFDGSNARPDILHSNAWDSLSIVVAALQRRSVHASAADINKEISNVRNYAGALGRYDFHKTPQRGLGADSVVIDRWSPEKDAFVAVSRPGGSPL